MESSYLSLWLTAQILLEAGLVGLMIVFFLRLRRLSRARIQTSEDLEARFTHFITQAQTLSEQLTRNLEEKRALSQDLLTNLERKNQEMKRLLDKAEQVPDRPASLAMENPSAPETRALVLKLDASGMNVAEIARKVRLHRGEVELLLELARRNGGASSAPLSKPAAVKSRRPAASAAG